jgi:hypothetical protein
MNLPVIFSASKIEGGLTKINLEMMIFSKRTFEATTASKTGNIDDFVIFVVVLISKGSCVRLII